MKWVLIFIYIVGPVDAPLSEMKVTEVRHEYRSLQLCTEAEKKVREKVEALPDFRGSASTCDPYDPDLHFLDE